MGFVPGDDPRVRHARDYTFVCCGLGVLSWALLALTRGVGIWNAAVPQLLHWWTPVLGGLSTILYGVAGWGIGRRDPRAAALALALFGWRILSAMLTGRPLSISTAIGLLGIGLIVRAAQPLGLPSRRTVA
jgi:hypothetical protein